MNQQVFAPGEPEGYRIPDRPKDWFSYPVRFPTGSATTIPPTGAGSTQTFQLQIDAGSDFFMTALTYYAHVSGITAVIDVSTYVVPQVTLMIQDTGSNRQLFNDPVPIPMIAGDGNHPHRLIHPRLFKRNSAIKLAIASIDSTNTYDLLYLNLEGFRIYG